MGMVLNMTIAKRRGGNQAGVTLVEVLVAITILALSLLALAPMFTGAVRTNASANQLTNANTLAREKLEELSGYPRNDTRLNVPAGANAAGPTTASVGTGSVVAVNPACQNDLPKWHKPVTGQTSTADTSPGAGWFQFPYTRTYTIEQFEGNLTTRVVAPNVYVVKLITVIVQPTRGPFPGLRQTRQSLYLRVRDLV
jgi:prepilin-type N-terminal cleavage/methylation domain-containing protein